MTNIKVSILNSTDEPAWQAYVNSHPYATIYHTLEWRDVLYKEYRFEPVYLIAREINQPHPHLNPLPEGEETSLLPPLQGEGLGGDGVSSEQGKVVGVLPMFLVKNLRGRRLVSLPFSIYGGPLADSTEITSALICKCMEMVKEGKGSSIEIKPHTHIGCNVAGVEAIEWGTGITLDITAGIDALWKGLTDRNDVNRAIREGLRFLISDGDGIEEFYKLQLMTRKRLGLPTPGLRYYRSFFEKMPGVVNLALVEKDGILVAGGVFFVYKGTVLYALGASDHRYLNCRPNDLLIWEMMRWASEAGFNVFDLGPTLSEDKGLLHFKKKWGGVETESVRYYFPDRPKDLQTAKGNLLFNMMPVRVSGVIGRHVLRYLG